jgi:hypothetical protein
MSTDSSDTNSQSHSESCAAQSSDVQLGLLDLDVDLSVPEVYAGSDFTVYLHVKNPFGRPVWIKSVELSLPAQLSTRQPAKTASRHLEKRQRANVRFLQDVIARRESRIRELRDSDHEGSHDEEIESLEENNRIDLGRLIGGATIRARSDSNVHLERARTPSILIDARSGGNIMIEDYQGLEEPERVPLLQSLPKGAALQPGSTEVSTIRLGTGRNPFFIPAKYHLQITVIYSLEPEEVKERKLFSDTASFTVPVRAALWSVLAGGVLGGIFGSLGRALQGYGSIGGLFGKHSGVVVGALALAVILSGAAVVFGARKADAQSFITVEDFWGGVLVGFLIGYSGTAAFTQLTGVHS